ncbi:MAG: hypothetical protein JRI59_01400 [Deltaproteobacteria bacterium]|nr:hypothetical protein [Deltaproteobacteria bacterium]
MAERIGIAINPHILALLFRVDAVVTGNYGFKVRLMEGGLSGDYSLLDCGYNRKCGQFWLIFAHKDDPAPGEVRWLSPVYEKEEGHETDPERLGF